MRIMTNAERSKAIRDRIKAELGYNSRQVGIRSSDCGYSDETRITVKDLSCDIDAIKKIAESFESIRYDEYSGEILSGANTYIFVDYDYRILNEAKQAELENAEKAIIDAVSGNQVFFKDKDFEYVIIVSYEERYDGSGVKKSCEEYVIAKQKPGSAGNVLQCCTSIDGAKWIVARILAIGKARAKA